MDASLCLCTTFLFNQIKLISISYKLCLIYIYIYIKSIVFCRNVRWKNIQFEKLIIRNIEKGVWLICCCFMKLPGRSANTVQSRSVRLHWQRHCEKSASVFRRTPLRCLSRGNCAAIGLLYNSQTYQCLDFVRLFKTTV